jgi:hypothetical protein
MGHVQAEDIDPRIHQFADHLGGIGDRAQSGYDFGAPQIASLHHGRKHIFNGGD